MTITRAGIDFKIGFIIAASFMAAA